MIRGVNAGLPQTVPGAHVSARRYHASTAPAPTSQTDAAVTNAMRCGAATMATPASQALPRPRLPSSIGIAQHDAAPNAATSPPIASRSAPVSFVVSRSLGVDRASSITAAYRGASRMPLRWAGTKQTRNHNAARTARSCHPQQLTRPDPKDPRQLGDDLQPGIARAPSPAHPLSVASETGLLTPPTSRPYAGQQHRWLQIGRASSAPPPPNIRQPPSRGRCSHNDRRCSACGLPRVRMRRVRFRF